VLAQVEGDLLGDLRICSIGHIMSTQTTKPCLYCGCLSTKPRSQAAVVGRVPEARLANRERYLSIWTLVTLNNRQ
jgi:hypothetical protein